MILKRLEFLAIAAALLGFVFKGRHWPNAFELLVIGLSSLALIYLIKFMTLNKTTPEKKGPIQRAAFFGFAILAAVSCITILGCVMFWPSLFQFKTVNFFLLLGGIIASIFVSQGVTRKSILTRFIPLVLVIGFFQYYHKSYISSTREDGTNIRLMHDIIDNPTDAQLYDSFGRRIKFYIDSSNASQGMEIEGVNGVKGVKEVEGVSNPE